MMNDSISKGVLIDSYLLENFIDQAPCEMKLADGFLNYFDYAMIFSPLINETDENMINSALFSFDNTARFF